MVPNDTKPINILVVDDDIINRILLERWLLSDSTLSVSQVKCAVSLGAAMELFGTNEFDVVLLDLNLPDSKDLHTLSEVINKAPQTAVIVVTGECGETPGLRAIAGGAQDYLVKASFDHEVLSRSIHYAIERKRMQEAEQIAFKELENAHSELKEMQSQILQSEKLASIGQLAAGVAHEMNTPMGFVGSNFQTLMSYMKKFLDLFAMYEQLQGEVEGGSKINRLSVVEQIKQARTDMKIDFVLKDIQELFEESREGIQRVSHIIQNLRDFSRIDQPEELVDFNLNDGIKTTLVVARNEIRYDAEIVTNLGPIPRVRCSSGQINQVFLAILVNAAQAIKSQQRETKGTITIKTYATEAKVVCEISDDGPGIPEDKISKIFDPFFTTKPVGKGTGLGLSVAYDIIVNKHKGKLAVDSTVGRGTTFTLRLPAGQGTTGPGDHAEVNLV